MKAIDIFCGAGGLTCGFRMAGINVLGGIDSDRKVKDTYQVNNPNSLFLHADIKHLRIDVIQAAFNVETEDPNLIIAGCSPCQFWSKVSTNHEKALGSKHLLRAFGKVCLSLKPGFILMENVPGLFIRSKESGLDWFKRQLLTYGYNFRDGLIKVSDFGVPQKRVRYIFLASRLPNSRISLPAVPKLRRPPLVRYFIGSHNGFPRIPAGHRDNKISDHNTLNLSERNLARIRLIPHNGGRRRVPESCGFEANPGHTNSQAFRDVYGRISWDQPAPTITTKFHSFSNGCFGHPEEDRALSIREGATLQTFPRNYRFVVNSLEQKARMIGNAVPPLLAKRLGLHLLRVSRVKKQTRMTRAG